MAGFPLSHREGRETKPSARPVRELTTPGDRKARPGPIAASHIGLARRAAEWRFFTARLARLRGLAGPP